jgi:myo-inositol 2-dehydrogenase / D-chiro-inositol 1-dehydrogenase
MSKRSSRRDFLKTSAVAGGAVAAGWSAVANVHAGGNNNALRVGLVGCGGRGTGAAEQCLRADSNVRLVAIADVFRDRAERCLTDLRGVEAIATRVAVPNANIFVGLGAYQQVLQNCDLVLLATPPGFRPIHITAAVAARKHIFTEKPVGVDGPGIRAVLAAYDTANQHHLAVVAGTQRRNQTGYIESMQRIHAGDIGTVTSATCYWNQGGLWHRNREPNQTDVAWQLRNWLYFTWLSGDHICEQHVHNLDVANWALGAHPVRCVGMGGRQVRTSKDYGNIYDHFAIEYEYPNGARVASYCRQIPGCENNVSEQVVGTKGNWTGNGYKFSSGATARVRGERNPYEQEHIDLVESIRSGKPLNELQTVAESTLTAIMGRMSTYTGKAVTWEQALISKENLLPQTLAMGPLPTPPIAVPGQTELI